MSYDIERDWTTKAGLRGVVIRLNDRSSARYNHRCGYVEVPKGHPLYGVEYSDKTDKLHPLADDEPTGNRGPITLLQMGWGDFKETRPAFVFNVHGSLTYSGGGKKYPVESDGWWFGFDAGHSGDDWDGGQSQAYMEEQCESLAQQIVERTIVYEPPMQPAEKPA